LAVLQQGHEIKRLHYSAMNHLPKRV